MKRLATVVASTMIGVVAFANVAVADPPESTTAQTNGVELRGVRVQSSTGTPREPSYAIVNHNAEVHVVELVHLYVIGASDDDRHELSITSPRRIQLRANRSESLSLTYSGDPIMSGQGTGHYLFELHATVDGQPIHAIASTAYMCRIPVRH